MSGNTVTYKKTWRLFLWKVSITYNNRDWFCNIYFMLSSYMERMLFLWHLKTRQHGVWGVTLLSVAEINVKGTKWMYQIHINCIWSWKCTQARYQLATLAKDIILSSSLVCVKQSYHEFFQMKSQKTLHEDLELAHLCWINITAQRGVKFENTVNQILSCNTNCFISFFSRGTTHKKTKDTS